MTVQLVITGDPNTGAVQVQGPLDNALLVHWLLGEARRACDRMADSKEARPGNGGGPHLVLARDLPLAPPTAG